MAFLLIGLVGRSVAGSEALFLARLVGGAVTLAEVAFLFEALVLFEGTSSTSSTSSLRLFVPLGARPPLLD